MLNKLVAQALSNRMLLAVALPLFVALVALTLPKLSFDAFPDVTNVQVAINTEAPGLAAEEVEKLITFPVEAAMFALPDVQQVRSISKTGLSNITVVFDEGVDIYFARQLVFERLQSAKSLIPAGVGMPEIGPNTSGLGQVYQYLLKAAPESGIDATILRSLNDYVVKLLLMPIDGVTDVLSFGGEVRQYQVNINPSLLLAYALTQADVVEALERSNQNAGGWYLQRGQEQLVIRGVGWIEPGQSGLIALAQTPLKTVDGTVVRIADVADVSFGAEIRQGAVTMTGRDENGQAKAMGEVVTGIVLKRIGANTKATIEGIENRQLMINQALPEGVSFVVIYDQSALVSRAIDTVVTALFQAFVFIIVVLTLFLLNLRAVMLVLLSIPLSLGLAVVIMTWYDISANLMSLGGLAVAIGMMVDGAVVMMENIIKHLQRQTQSFDIVNIVKIAAGEVSKPIFFAVSIILVVFTPLFALEGVEGKLFEPMAVSIMIAMAGSVIVALMVVPALACILFKRGYRVKQNRWLAVIEHGYHRLLSRIIEQKGMVVGCALFLLIAAGLLLPRLGTEFVPQLEEGTINLRVTLAPSSSLDTALSVAPKLEQMLLQFPEVEYALSRIGRPELGGDPEPVSNIEIYIGLKPQQQWQSASNRIELQGKMLTELEQFPGLLFNFSQPIATRVDELLSGVKAQLAIKLFGPDLLLLAEKGKAIERLVSQVDGTTDVAMEQMAGEAQLVIRPKRNQLSRYGLSVGDLMDLVNDGLGGSAAGQVIDGNERYDIYVRLAKNFRDNVHAIRQLRLQSPTGAWVRLSDVAEVAIESGTPQVRRDDVQRRVVIQANVQGRDMGGVVEQIRQTITEQVDLPQGYSVTFGGQFENQQRAQRKLTLIVPLSVLLIALLLYLTFRSISQTLLVLVNLPLALIGSVFALYISGQYLSVPGSIGFITLIGVAVLNGVVLMEAVNLKVKDNPENATTAILDAAVSRLRPVLMTASTSALGLIPLMIATGAGAEIQKPLAIVVVGGLVTSTLLTLIVLPTLYDWLYKRRLRPAVLR